MKIKRKSILIKLFRTIFLVVIILALIMVTSIYGYYKVVMEKELIHMNKSILNQTSERVSADILDFVNLAREISYNHKIIEELSIGIEKNDENKYFLKESIKNIIDEYRWSNSRRNQLFSAYVIDTEGNVFSSSYSNLNEVDDILSEENLYKFISMEKDEIIVKTEEKKNLKGIYRYSFQVVKKITDHITGDLYGIVLLNISENVLYSTYRDLITENKEVYITDDHGMIISSKNKLNLFNKVLLDNEKTLNIDYFDNLNYNSGQLNVIKNSYQGREEYVLGARIPGTQWYLFQSIASEVILKSLENVLLYSVAITAIFIIIIYILIKIYTKKITKPISYIKEKMNSVKSENYNTRMNMKKELNLKDMYEFTEIENSFNLMMGNLNESILTIKEKEKQKRLIEQDFLRAQINPHFIYNALTSIRFFISMGKKDEAEDMILYFSKILRKTLSRADEFINLKEEIETIKDYIELQKFRYPNSIDVEYKIDNEVLKCQVPSFILQPIVENSIFHGMKEDSICNIIIEAYKKEKKLIINIIDDGKGISEDKIDKIFDKNKDFHINKVGLKNVRERIRINYGNEYGLYITSKESLETKITFELAFRKDD